MYNFYLESYHCLNQSSLIIILFSSVEGMISSKKSISVFQHFMLMATRHHARYQYICMCSVIWLLVLMIPDYIGPIEV